MASVARKTTEKRLKLYWHRRMQILGHRQRTKRKDSAEILKMKVKGGGCKGQSGRLKSKTNMIGKTCKNEEVNTHHTQSGLINMRDILI